MSVRPGRVIYIASLSSVNQTDLMCNEQTNFLLYTVGQQDRQLCRNTNPTHPTSVRQTGHHDSYKPLNEINLIVQSTHQPFKQSIYAHCCLATL